MVNRAWSVARPRDETARVAWRPRDGAIAVADDPLSFGAVRRVPGAAVTWHFSFHLDAAALGVHSARSAQDRRAERRMLRQADIVLAYSQRLVDRAGRGVFTPAAFPMPEGQPDPVDRPTVALVADWAWPPNRHAVRWLLSVWPEVRRRVPGARLLLAGRNGDDLGVGGADDVRFLGPVDRVADVLAEAAVVAFPCPATSGPKVKVMEALAHARAVVTTPAGMEGLMVTGHGAVVAPLEAFGDALTALLLDPERRDQVARVGHAELGRHHAPSPAARARVEAYARALR